MPISWQYNLGLVYFNTADEPDDLGCIYVMPEPLGWDSPPVRQTPVDIPYADGSDIPDSWWSARTIHATGTLVAPNVQALAAGRARLLTATRLMRADGQFIERPVDGSPDRYCTVRRLGQTAFPTRYSTGATGFGGSASEGIAFDFQLVAGDPLKYNVTPTVVIVSSSTTVGGLTFPLTFPVTFAADADVLTATAMSPNAGTVDTGYVAAFNGPLRNPVLIDRLTDNRIALNVNIPAGRSYLVDTHAETITVDGQPDYDVLDSSSSAMADLIVPAGGSCAWLLLGQGAGSCTITSKDANE